MCEPTRHLAKGKKKSRISSVFLCTKTLESCRERHTDFTWKQTEAEKFKQLTKNVDSVDFTSTLKYYETKFP